MFQDLHVIDFHAHFPIKTDMAHGHGPQKREVGPIENPAARRHPSTASWRRRFDGPWSVRPSISPIAQRWRASTSRVESARRRIACFHSRSSGGSSISPKTMSTIPSRS